MLLYQVKLPLSNGWCHKMGNILDSVIVNPKEIKSTGFSMSTEGKVTIPLLNIILNLINDTIGVRKGKELIIPESMNLADVTVYELIEDPDFVSKFTELATSGMRFDIPLYRIYNVNDKSWVTVVYPFFMDPAPGKPGFKVGDIDIDKIRIKSFDGSFEEFSLHLRIIANPVGELSISAKSGFSSHDENRFISTANRLFYKKSRYVNVGRHVTKRKAVTSHHRVV